MNKSHPVKVFDRGERWDVEGAEVVEGSEKIPRKVFRRTRKPMCYLGRCLVWGVILVELGVVFMLIATYEKGWSDKRAGVPVIRLIEEER